MSEFEIILAVNNLRAVSPLTLFINAVFAFPFFWVWLFSLFVWFFLELTVYFSNFFNTKHSYTNDNLNNANLNYYYNLVIKNNKYSFLKKIYKLYF